MIFVHFWWWLEHVIGADNLSGPAYGFWSGFGSDIAEVAILGGIVQMYRKHNCHVTGCWRIAKYPVPNTPYIVCKRHAPHIADTITHEHVKSLYNKIRRND